MSIRIRKTHSGYRWQVLSLKRVLGKGKSESYEDAVTDANAFAKEYLRAMYGSL